MLSLADLVTWMLQPRRAAASDEAPMDDADLVDFTDELLRFPESIRELGDSLLDDIDQPTTLSQLLSAVSDWDGPDELQEYLVLSALRQFAPENDDDLHLLVQKVANEELSANGFYGDALAGKPGLARLSKRGLNSLHGASPIALSDAHFVLLCSAGAVRFAHTGD